MSEIKKTIIIGYCIIMGVAAMYVPWKVDLRTDYFSTTLDKGYSFFLSQPIPQASIDYGKILLEFVVISALAIVLYLVSGKTR